MLSRQNGESYFYFIRNELPQLLEDVSLNLRRDILFLHDGCFANFNATICHESELRCCGRSKFRFSTVLSKLNSPRKNLCRNMRKSFGISNVKTILSTVLKKFSFYCYYFVLKVLLQVCH